MEESLEKPWSWYWDVCVICRTTKFEHCGLGMCNSCYNKCWKKDPALLSSVREQSYIDRINILLQKSLYPQQIRVLIRMIEKLDKASAGVIRMPPKKKSERIFTDEEIARRQYVKRRVLHYDIVMAEHRASYYKHREKQIKNRKLTYVRHLIGSGRCLVFIKLNGKLIQGKATCCPYKIDGEWFLDIQAETGVLEYGVPLNIVRYYVIKKPHEATPLPIMQQVGNSILHTMQKEMLPTARMDYKRAWIE